METGIVVREIKVAEEQLEVVAVRILFAAFVGQADAVRHIRVFAALRCRVHTLSVRQPLKESAEVGGVVAEDVLVHTIVCAAVVDDDVGKVAKGNRTAGDSSAVETDRFSESLLVLASLDIADTGQQSARTS